MWGLQSRKKCRSCCLLCLAEKRYLKQLLQIAISSKEHLNMFQLLRVIWFVICQWSSILAKQEQNYLFYSNTQKDLPQSYYLNQLGASCRKLSMSKFGATAFYRGCQAINFLWAYSTGNFPEPAYNAENIYLSTYLL